MIHNKIILLVHKNLVINGILFYCIEHYLYLSKKMDVELCIIYDGDINYIKEIIQNKYFISDEELDNIKHIKILDVLRTSTRKALILDTDTYCFLSSFSKRIEKIFLYSNDNNYIKRPQDITYGFYDYQNFDIKERLKLGFEFMKPKIPHINKTFCSAPIYEFEKIDKDHIEKISTYDVTYKNFNKDLDVFKFKEIIYYHTKNLDRNNRIIPEAFYFGNKITLINNIRTNDSVNERYNICLNSGYKTFEINDNYKLTKDFLEY